MNIFIFRQIIKKSVYTLVLLSLLLSNLGMHVSPVSAQEEVPETPTATPVPEEGGGKPIEGTPTETPLPEETLTPTGTATEIPTYTPTPEEVSMLAMEVNALAGEGTIFRARVELKQPRDLARLNEWAMTVLENGTGYAFVQVNEEQLEKLARLGFAPSQIDSIEYLVAAYSQLQGDVISMGDVTSSSEDLMALSSLWINQIKFVQSAV